jgi:metal-responsive CopG/Arc/MetJ family transcriptional regulator
MHAEPLRVSVSIPPPLLAALDAYRRAAPGLPSRAEAIREAVRALASIKPVSKTRAMPRKVK